MWANSAAETFACFSGRRYVGNQKSSQMKPIAPVSTNAQRQPRCIAIQGTVNGATIAPTFEPALKMPVAKARSFFGNHSATVLIAAGKFPPASWPTFRAILPIRPLRRFRGCV